MPVFKYSAIDVEERLERGTAIGDTARLVRDDLRSRGLQVLDLSEVVGPSTNKQTGNERRSVRKPVVVAGFFAELATLLSVGVPLAESLETLAFQSRGKFQTCLLQVLEQLRRGHSLASAMSGQTGFFDELSLNLVEVGENTGRLDHSLECLARYKQRALELKNQVVSALIYPALILVASVGVSLFLMTVVVPMLLENLEDLGKSLPWPTRVLKAGSDFLIAYGLWMAIPLGMAAVGVVWLQRIPEVRRLRERMTLKLPLIGTMVRKQEISRLALVISTLMASGLEFLQCLEIARKTTGNGLLADSIGKIAKRIESGKDLGPALRDEEFFPPVVAHVFAIGQKTGKLDSLLLRLSEDYDRDVSTLTGRLAVLIEPVMIIVLSVVVGFILFATLLPILEAGNVL